LGAEVAFPARTEGDPVIGQFGDPQMIADMGTVFFTSHANASGHSYAALMRGPAGRQDLQDVIALLRSDPWSKRAVVTLCGTPNGKVPCINVIQFLIRDKTVRTTYFARGQDAFRKFYADGLCIAAMARTVAGGLDLPAGTVAGYIASSHVYDQDMADIKRMLAQGQHYLRAGGCKGAV
jgi:thymidylate synthase